MTGHATSSCSSRSSRATTWTPTSVLISAALIGDTAHFAREDEVEAAWAIVDPLLHSAHGAARIPAGQLGPGRRPKSSSRAPAAGTTRARSRRTGRARARPPRRAEVFHTTLGDTLAENRCGRLALSFALRRLARPLTATTPQRVARVLAADPAHRRSQRSAVGDPRALRRRSHQGRPVASTAALPAPEGCAPLMTDIPRLRAGGVGAQFWSVCIPASVTGPAAVQMTLEQIDLVKRMCARYPNDLAMAYTRRRHRAAAQGAPHRLPDRRRGRPSDQRLPRGAACSITTPARAT